MKRESIKDILENGGTVELPFKSSINEWYSNIRIYCLEKNRYVVEPQYQKFSNIDEAVNWFLKESTTSKNVGYVQSRLSRTGVNFESYELDDLELKSMIEKEGKIVDAEFKSMNITVNPFPKKSDAIKEINRLPKEISIDNLVAKISTFENKYITLDPYINLSFIYEYYDNKGNLNEFESSINYNFFNIDLYNERLNRSDIKYKNARISIKVRGSKYISHNLNF